MAKVKSMLHAVAHVARVIVHDPTVESAAKHTAAVMAVRALLAVGASAGVVEAVKAVLAHAGVV